MAIVYYWEWDHEKADWGVATDRYFLSNRGVKMTRVKGFSLREREGYFFRKVCTPVGVLATVAIIGE